MFFKKRRSKRRTIRRTNSQSSHYLAHKEEARRLVHARLKFFNQHYNFQWNRVAIRNQRRCWGSCSSLKNLNFNYKILLLPPHLQDYIVVHELCHLAELNHGPAFWELVARAIPDYTERVLQLRHIDRGGGSIVYLEKVQRVFADVGRTEGPAHTSEPILNSQRHGVCDAR